MPTAPPRLATLAAALSSTAHEILFEDRSGHGHDPDDTTPPAPARLADMADPHHAAANCRTATAAVNAALNHLAPEVETGTIQGHFDSGHSRPGHQASTVRLDGQTWVFDFTARQFDETAPLPLVVRVETWKKTLESWAESHGWQVRTDPT